MIIHRQFFRVLALAMMVGVALRPALIAQVVRDDPQRLPSFVTTSSQVANQTPGATIAMPVSGLRYEP